jgi:hypothetical protein
MNLNALPQKKESIMPIFPGDLKSPVVDELIAVVINNNLTVRQAAEALDAAKAKLGDVKIQTFSTTAQDEPKIDRIHALKELRLV